MNCWKCTVSIPFRKDGNRKFLPDAVFEFDEKYIDLYAAAVTREVIAAAEDLEDVHISCVEFCGCTGLIRGSMLKRITDCIRRCFPVGEDTAWIVHSEAGALSTDFLRFCSALPVTELRLDYRTSSAAESAAMGLQPPTADILHDRQLLKETGFGRYSIMVSDNGCNKTDVAWEDTLRTFSALDAASIRLPLCTGEARMKTADAILTAQGYVRSPEDAACYARDGSAAYHEAEPDGILGIGLNAVTFLPEGKCRNTSDLFTYLSHSDDITVISRPVR